MNSNEHHVVSLTLGPIGQVPSGAWYRSLTWLDDNGRMHDLTLFAERGPECLTLLGEQAPGIPDEGSVDLRAAPQPRFNVGDKVTPIKPGGFFRAGGIYTVSAIGLQDCVFLDGENLMWPMSMFGLADPDPLANTPRFDFHKWEQIALDAFEADIPYPRVIWVHDGQLGFARLLREGETRQQALADFNTAGEEWKGWKLYERGIQIDAIEKSVS